MKIGMILDAEDPDDARITNQCDELTKYNHEVHLLCLSYKKSFVTNEITPVSPMYEACSSEVPLTFLITFPIVFIIEFVEKYYTSMLIF